MMFEMCLLSGSQCCLYFGFRYLRTQTSWSVERSQIFLDQMGCLLGLAFSSSNWIRVMYFIRRIVVMKED